MICPICRQAEIVDGLTSIPFGRGEFKLVVNNVPAHVCLSCGEAYVDEYVAIRLIEGAQKMYRAGMLEITVEYEEFSRID